MLVTREGGLHSNLKRCKDYLGRGGGEEGREKGGGEEREGRRGREGEGRRDPHMLHSPTPLPACVTILY